MLGSPPGSSIANSAISRRLLAILVVVGVVAGSCADNTNNEPSAASQQAATGPTQESSSNTADSTSDGVLDSESADIFDLGVSDDDTLFLANTLEELIRRCMKERGYPYTPTDFTAAPPALRTIAVMRLQSKSEADEQAYGIATIRSESSNEDDQGGVKSFTDPNGDYLDQVGEAEKAAWVRSLYGVRDAATEAAAEASELAMMEGEVSVSWIQNDGCISNSEAKIYGDFQPFLELEFIVKNQLYNEPIFRVQASPAYIEGVRDWSTCMLVGGHEYAEPGDAVRDAFEAYRTLSREQAIQFEAELASADGACAEKVGLFDTVDIELAEALDRVRTDYEGQILGYRELTVEAVERAKELLG